MNTEESENVELWLATLSEESAKNILTDLIDHMVMTEDLRILGKNGPYWCASGDRIDGEDWPNDD